MIPDYCCRKRALYLMITPDRPKRCQKMKATKGTVPHWSGRPCSTSHNPFPDRSLQAFDPVRAGHAPGKRRKSTASIMPQFTAAEGTFLLQDIDMSSPGNLFQDFSILFLRSLFLHFGYLFSPPQLFGFGISFIEYKV